MADLPLPDEHVENDGNPKIKLPGVYQSRSREEIEALARRTPAEIRASLEAAAKDNPLLYLLLNAVPENED